jgi:hypothetical protein
METIHVPGPPKQAFNKNRRISDLIRAQVNHLKHVEASLPAEQRGGIPQHEITTESQAANYIAAMTNLFQSKAAAAPVKPATPITLPTPVPIKPAASISTPPPSPGLAIAAGADTAQKKTKPKKSKAPPKEKRRKKQ